MSRRYKGYITAIAQDENGDWSLTVLYVDGDVVEGVPEAHARHCRSPEEGQTRDEEQEPVESDEPVWVLLIRHGQSEANAQKAHMPDPALTDLGRRQALSWAPVFGASSDRVEGAEDGEDGGAWLPRRVLISPLLRTIQTAALVFSAMDAEMAALVKFDPFPCAREKWWVEVDNRGKLLPALEEELRRLPAPVSSSLLQSTTLASPTEFWDPDAEAEASKRELGRRERRCSSAFVAELCRVCDEVGSGVEEQSLENLENLDGLQTSNGRGTTGGALVVVVAHWGTIRELTDIAVGNCTGVLMSFKRISPPRCAFCNAAERPIPKKEDDMDDRGKRRMKWEKEGGKNAGSGGQLLLRCNKCFKVAYCSGEC